MANRFISILKNASLDTASLGSRSLGSEFMLVENSLTGLTPHVLSDPISRPSVQSIKPVTFIRTARQ